VRRDLAPSHSPRPIRSAADLTISIPGVDKADAGLTLA